MIKTLLQIILTIDILHMIYTDFHSLSLYFFDILIFGTINLLTHKVTISFIDIFLLIFMIYMAFRKYIGDGDIYLYTVMIMVNDDLRLMYIMFISSLLTLIYMIYKNNKMAPYGPFILISFLIIEYLPKVF